MIAWLLRMVNSCVRRSCSFSMRLANPGERRAERHEHCHPYGNGDERALGPMHYDLVDDGLREQRNTESEQLDNERGGQHLTPYRLVP